MSADGGRNPSNRMAAGGAGLAHVCAPAGSSYAHAFVRHTHERRGHHRRQGIRGRSQAEVGRRAALVKEQHGLVPGLSVVLVGDDPASHVYVRNKGKATAAAGMDSQEYRLPDSATHEEVLETVERLNADDSVHGILVQLPLPDQVDSNAIINSVDPDKDVDGFHTTNVGRAHHRAGESGAVHAARLHAHAAPLRGRAERQAGDDRRPLQYRRQAHGVAAAARALHRDRRPLAHPGPPRRMPAAPMSSSRPSGGPR